MLPNNDFSPLNRLLLLLPLFTVGCSLSCCGRACYVGTLKLLNCVCQARQGTNAGADDEDDEDEDEVEDPPA